MYSSSRIHRLALLAPAARRQLRAADLAAAAIAAEIEARKAADALILAEQGRWYTAEHDRGN